MYENNKIASKSGQEVLRNTRYLMIEVTQDGQIRKLECPGLAWCVTGLSVGRPIPETLQAILDVCDTSSGSQFFPYVQLADDLSADVHVLKSVSDTQIILHDVNVAFEGTQKYLQKARDSALLLEQQANLNHLLERRRREAETANQAKSRFVAMMTDEFRSPISSIMAHAEALQAEHENAREPAAIQRASWYLLTLLENLLEQSRMDNQERKVETSAVEVSGLLADMQGLFGKVARSRGLNLDVHGSEDARFVLADELRLRQVLFNLLSNAMRYTSEGSIGFYCRRQQHLIKFSVVDTGRGIAEQDRERIFQPFERIEPEGKHGAGIGLTVSQKLVEAMGGELSVESSSGEGSTFSFCLPVTEDRIDSIETLEGLSALLVEDNVDTRDMYLSWLETWGVRAQAVRGYEAAITEFNNNPPDLVLSDLFLEGGNGVELLTTLRTSHSRVATVLCSSSAALEDFLGTQGAIINAFVRKPVNAKRLAEALQTAVRLAKAH